MGFRLTGFPRSIFIIDWLLLVAGLSGTRFFIRITRPYRFRQRNQNSRRKKILIVGAGDAGEMILREMIYRYSHNYEVVGLIDDDPKKYKRRIHGVAVLGTRLDIPDTVEKNNVEEIVIAIPSLKSEQMREVVSLCIKSGAKYRTVPNISDVMDGAVKVRELREVQVEDLLGRDEVLINKERVRSYIEGKNVLITGAGGSIGSELCRQVARFEPGELVLFEKSENALFYIDMELDRAFSGLNKIAVIGDICDRRRVREVLSEHSPDIIFHAAAYKHVPLMEANSMEAVKNNIFGTKVLAQEAVKAGVKRFIMLSTDKAVEPVSLMGVSKKIAELYISGLGRINGVRFMAVRFGNVLGSEGSVIPTFRKQIAKGGPVTITHPDIKRYFMTIPEAVGLVLEAGFMGSGGEVFILEMGKQIKIVDLAKDMIRLSGLEPCSDIEMVFTGLRPGEKMQEALVAHNEKLIRTVREKIMVLKPQQDNRRDIFKDINSLQNLVKKQDMKRLIEKLKEVVPDYKPSPQLLAAFPRLQEERTMSRAREVNKVVDILIADDDEIIRKLLSKFLEGRGYSFFLASSGREALEVIRNDSPRIAIIDIKMPGFIDGLGVLRHIKKGTKNIGVIVITGFGNARIRKLSSRLGAYAYFEKPFALADIQRRVEQPLGIEAVTN